MPPSKNTRTRVIARSPIVRRLSTLVGFSLIASASVYGAGPLPDLTINGPAAAPVIVSQTFAADDCSVLTGCALAGTRKLLRFRTETWNIGAGDLVIGDPATNPLYEWNACRHRHLFNGFADFRLLDGSGIVATGHKSAFCLLDSFRHDDTANPTRVYNTCLDQGIQAGWADIYSAGLPCQWIDITDVPPGLYTLQMETNPDLLLAESDYSNNVANVPVVIPGGGGGPICTDAVPVENGVYPFSTLGAPTDGPDEPAGCNANGYTHIESDVWFCYTAPGTCGVKVSLCGSGYDTKMAVYDGCVCPVTSDRLLACNDDSCGVQSEVTFPAVEGNTYLIRVGGFQGAQGDGTMTISSETCTGNLPDLIVNDAVINPVMGVESFRSSDCAVQEGCVRAGTRTLLRFTTETPNIGTADLVLGDPAGAPLYNRFSSCLGAFQFPAFTEYRLIDAGGVVATAGQLGRCIEDSAQYDSGATPLPIYNCGNQGISVGWAKRYESTEDCQWIDVTDVAPGLYTLEIEVNPLRLLPESNYANNVASIQVAVVGGGGGLCTDAVAIGNGVYPFSTVGVPTDGPDEPAGCNENGYTHIEHDVWFCYTAAETCDVRASLCGSQYDTKMAVYDGCACPVTAGRLLACNDDSCGVQSEVTFSAVQGNSYLIRIGGSQAAQGIGTLTIGNLSCQGTLPDLIVNDAVAAPTIVTETFAASDCAVQEGCIVEGTRKLLRFTTETPNVGAADLVLGDPSAVPMYSLSPCWGTYRFDAFAEYRLTDGTGTVATSRQVGVCLEDSVQYDGGANPTPVYGCTNQGIQVGWAKRYASTEDCQWLDITNVAPGSYTLEIEVNPLHVLPESDYGNNVVSIPFVIPCDTVPALTMVCPGLGPDDPRDASMLDRFIWPKSRHLGCTSIDLELNDVVSLVDANSWCTKVTGGATPPSVAGLVSGPGLVHTVQFDGPIPVGEWTTVVLTVVNACGLTADVCFLLAHLPDDLDQNAQVSLADATRFGILFRPEASLKLLDLDGNGQVSLTDATKFGQIWRGVSGEGRNPDGTGAWLGTGLPDADPGTPGTQVPTCTCP